MTDEIKDLLEREAVVAALVELFVATDCRDWVAARRCFPTVVHLGLSSVGGGEPGPVAADDVIAGWAQGLAPLVAIHHQVGNFQVKVKADRASATCYGTAYHYLPNRTGRNTRTFVGTYDADLRKTDGRWLIERFSFALKFLEGLVDAIAIEDPGKE
jgi:hypothetical protein